MALYASNKLICYKWLCNAICPSHLTNAALLPIPTNNEYWQEIIYLGSVHGVLPLLYESLKSQHRLDQLPTDVSEALEGFYELNCLFNNKLREQIINTTRSLNISGIKPVWLKGAINLLASNWEKSSRTMLDLDLWIPDPEEQLLALEIFYKNGYYIQPESVNADYDRCQHFAPIIKNGQPARLEIHRNVVDPECAALLTDASALNNTIWIKNNELTYGILSQNHLIMQSYLQCTEQMSDCLNPRGTARLIKITDFLQRINSNEIFKNFFSCHSVLHQKRWKQKARQFTSHLNEYFLINAPIPLDKSYLRNSLLALNFPKLEIIYHIISHGFYLFLTGKLGSVNTWPSKLKRQLAFFKNKVNG